MEPALVELKKRLGEIVDLGRTQALLYWDMEVFMPPGGAGSRAMQLASLSSVTHERMIDDRIGELLDELAPYASYASRVTTGRRRAASPRSSWPRRPRRRRARTRPG
jgi:Zn-dependent M32 family carboxypeptidase